MFNKIAGAISVCIFCLFIAYIFTTISDKQKNITPSSESEMQARKERAKENKAWQEKQKERKREIKDLASHHAIAETKCAELTRKGLKSSSSFKKEGVEISGEWEGVVLVVFSAKNPFGVRIDATSTCLFNKDSIELLGITEK